MSEASKKRRDALPPSERAGYKLDRSAAYPVLMKAPRTGQSVAMGWIDPNLGVYQGGGELKEIIFLPKQMMSWPIEVWEAMVHAGVTTIEMIDHDSNTSYRIPLSDCRRHGTQYSTKHGERWGVHLRHVSHVDSLGRALPREAKGNPEWVNPLQGRMEF